MHTQNDPCGIKTFHGLPVLVFEWLVFVLSYIHRWRQYFWFDDRHLFGLVLYCKFLIWICHPRIHSHTAIYLGGNENAGRFGNILNGNIKTWQGTALPIIVDSTCNGLVMRSFFASMGKLLKKQSSWRWFVMLWKSCNVTKMSCGVGGSEWWHLIWNL